MAGRGPIRLIVAALFGALALGASLLLFPRVEAPTSPDGRFVLTDSSGRRFAERSLRGRPYAIFFGYTRCPDVCPTTMQKLAQARHAAGLDAKLPIVFVSLDPAHDTPAGIADYAAAFGTNIIALTGSPPALRRAAEPFGVTWRPSPDGLITHTATSFLVDAKGRLASTIGVAEQPAAAADALRELAR